MFKLNFNSSLKEGRVKALWVKPQLAGQSDAFGRPKPVDAQAEERGRILYGIDRASAHRFSHENKAVQLTYDD